MTSLRAGVRDRPVIEAVVPDGNRSIAAHREYRIEPLEVHLSIDLDLIAGVELDVRAGPVRPRQKPIGLIRNVACLNLREDFANDSLPRTRAKPPEESGLSDGASRYEAEIVAEIV